MGKRPAKCRANSISYPALCCLNRAIWKECWGFAVRHLNFSMSQPGRMQAVDHARPNTALERDGVRTTLHQKTRPAYQTMVTL